MSAEIAPPAAVVVRRWYRLPVLVWFAFVSAGVLAVLAVFGRLLAPHDPSGQSLLDSASGPSGGHLLGTDGLGRDILSRVMVGASTALAGPLVVALGAVVLATTLGLVAGSRGGLVDTVIMRVADMFFAVPPLLVIIFVVGVFSGGYWLAVVMLVVLFSPSGTRIIRSAAMAQRNLPYLEAARTLGVRSGRLMFIHVLPNVLPNVVAIVLLDFVGGLIGLSSLSFLGLGAPPGTADWGQMLTENRGLLDQNPWAVVAPAGLLIVAAFAATILGDWAYARLEQRGNVRQ